MMVYVKNMVCNRCIRVVQEALEKLDLKVNAIRLGEVELEESPALNMQKIKEVLVENGFELLENKNVQLIEQIKTIVIEEIHHKKSKKTSQNFSDFLSEKTGRDYHFLAQLFSSKEGITIEKYIILQKIEKVKELLMYNEMNLSEISFQMEYSSVAHLSAQFKNVTGMSPSEFRKLNFNSRNPLDHL